MAWRQERAIAAMSFLGVDSDMEMSMGLSNREGRDMRKNPLK